MRFGLLKRACVVAPATVALVVAAASGATAATGGTMWRPVVPYGSVLTSAGGGQLPVFSSLSCTAPGDCVAAGTAIPVGSGTPQPVVAAESGGVWGPPAPVTSLPVDASSTPATTLPSISCTSATSCVAVGSYTETSGGKGAMTVPVSVSGSTATPGSASAVALPKDAGTGSSQNAALNGVSCLSSGDCTAVGSYALSGGGTLPVVAVAGAGGAWTTKSVTTAPAAQSPPTNPDATLTAISCPTTGACEAVGGYGDSSGNSYPWAVQVSDGAALAGQRVNLPSDFVASTSTSFLGSQFAANSLTAISCPSDGVCTAAGGYSDGASSGSPLVAPVVVPITAGLPGTAVKLIGAGVGPETALTGISCSGASDCSLVGTTTSQSTTQALTPVVGSESGGTWPPLTGLTLGAGDTFGYLGSVTCVSADVCTASGFEATSLGSGVSVNAFFANSAPPLSVATASLPAATVGVPYSARLQTTNAFGNLSWSIAPGSLPPGLSLDPATGVISGTPTTAGQDGFIADASDPGPPAQTASSGLSITVSPAAVPAHPTPHLIASVHIAYLTTAGRKAVLVLSCSDAPCTGTLTTAAFEHLEGRTPTAVAAIQSRARRHSKHRHGHARHKRKKRRTKRIMLASGRYSIAAGGTQVVTLTLTRNATRLLNRLHDIAGYLIVTPTGTTEPALMSKLVFRSASKPASKRHRKRAHRR
ncbi:MAG: putative Ig domain-containing protein [Solirubrobacteraceae bacterium]